MSHCAKLKKLRNKCPLPVLMQRLGYGDYAQKSGPSPFGDHDRNSWGIFQRNGRWFFYDFATKEGGDEVAFLARVNNLDKRDDLDQLLGLYAEVASQQAKDDMTPAVKAVGKASKPKPRGKK